MCNNITVFTKSAQKLNMLQFYSPFHWINSAGIFVILHGLEELEMLIMMLADACIFLQKKESLLAVGGWVYIENPARKMALSHTYM